MDVRIIANIGSLKGQSGDGMIYAAKTPGGTYLAAVKHLDGGTETWKYYRKSMIENAAAAQNVVLAGNFNLALITDQEQPDFVAETDTGIFKTITTVVNGADLPRLFQLQNPYSVKGDGVMTSEIEALKLGSSVGTGAGGSTTGATTGGGIGSSTGGTTGGMAGDFKLFPDDFSGLFKDPVKWVQDNVFFVVMVAGVIYYLRRKKKKPLWIL